MEKLGIEPATPGLQDICLSPTPPLLLGPWDSFMWLSWVYTSSAGLVKDVCVGFKIGNTQRKSFYGEVKNRTCDPGLQDIGLSPTPWQLLPKLRSLGLQFFCGFPGYK